MPAVLDPVLQGVHVGRGVRGPRLLGAGPVAVPVDLEDPRVGQALLDGARVARAPLEGGGAVGGAEQELEHGDLGEVPGQQAVLALDGDAIDGGRVQAGVGDQDVLAGQAQADQGDHARQERLDLAPAAPGGQDLVARGAGVGPAAGADLADEHAQVLVVVALDEDDVVGHRPVLDDEVHDARGVGAAVEQVADEDEQGGGVPAPVEVLDLGQGAGAALDVADDDDALVAGGVDLLDRVQAPHVVEAHDPLGHGGRAAADPGGDVRHDPGLDVAQGPAAGLVALDELGVGQVPLDVDDVDLVAAAPGERGEFAVALARGVGAVEQEGGALADPGGDGGLEGGHDLLLRAEGHGQGGRAVQVREGGREQASEVVQADGEVAEAVTADQSRLARAGCPAQDEHGTHVRTSSRTAGPGPGPSQSPRRAAGARR